MNDVSLVAAPGTIELDGTTYLVSSPTDSDIFMLMQYVTKIAKKSYKPVSEAALMLKGLTDISQTARDEIMLTAYKAGNSQEIPAERINEVMMSPVGCRFFAFILLKKNQPELKLEDLTKLITEDNWIEIFSELDEASGLRFIHKGLESSGFLLGVER